MRLYEASMLFFFRHSVLFIGEVPVGDYLEYFNFLKGVIFVWEASHRSILTCDNLQKRGDILVHRCSMCKEDL